MDMKSTFNPNNLPICPVVIPNTRSRYNPVHHIYLWYLCGMFPSSLKLVLDYTSNKERLTHPSTNDTNTKPTSPICHVILRHGEDKGARVTN